MTNLVLFENMPAAYKELLAKLEPETNITGGDFGNNYRLSIRGGVFRKVVNGKEVAELESRTLKVVVVKAAPISRMYYAGQYVAGENSPPACWSADTKTGAPSPDVVASDKQSHTCFDCKQNIKGSGQGDSRACRYQQRVALLLTDDDGRVVSNNVYQLTLPATSIFGDDQQKMSMQTYARYLNGHKLPLASVVTELRFDTANSTPKLHFKPLRPLDQEELELAIGVQQNPDTVKLVTLSVRGKEAKPSAAPAAGLLPSAFAKPTPVVTAPAAVSEPEEAIAEPKVKVSKKKSEAPASDVDLASLMDSFDDE